MLSMLSDLKRSECSRSRSVCSLLMAMWRAQMRSNRRNVSGDGTHKMWPRGRSMHRRHGNKILGEPVCDGGPDGGQCYDFGSHKCLI